MIIALVGSKGKMGQLIAQIATQRHHTILPIDTDSQHNEVLCDIVIDFSNASALDTSIAICLANQCPLICGTTGHNTQQLQSLSQLATQLPVVHRHNFCHGMPTMQTICQILAKNLPNWQYDIVEQHHSQKQDSPSGTAITLANQLEPHNCNMHSIRSGTTIGTHTIIASGDDEIITITHNAQSRSVFALGAVICAENTYADTLCNS